MRLGVARIAAANTSIYIITLIWVVSAVSIQESPSAGPSSQVLISARSGA